MICVSVIRQSPTNLLRLAFNGIFFNELIRIHVPFTGLILAQKKTFGAKHIVFGAQDIIPYSAESKFLVHKSYLTAQK